MKHPQALSPPLPRLDLMPTEGPSTLSVEHPPGPPLLQPEPTATPVKQNQPRQVTLGYAAALASLKRKKLTKEQNNQISRAITRYIVKEMQPFSTIASEPFRHMLKELNPEYIPPNKETLSSVYIPAWYDVEKHKLKQDLAEASAVGITADHWTSLNGDHYLTVTAHSVKDCTLINKVLETRAVYESQTGEAIGSEILECLTKFTIAHKVRGITVDNAANMAAGARFLNIMRLPCFAHSMNISASKLYNNTTFTRWLARIRSVVLWFKRVHMAGVILKEKLAALELPNHSVILDVKTRWNSMYLMVERFAEIYPGLSAACRDPRIKKRVEKEKVEKISDADLKKSEEFVECMKILYTSTLAISTDKLPTVGQVLPTYSKLEKSFTVQDDDSDFVKMVKTAVWKDMQNRYKDPEILHFLEEAAALNPRFKAKLLCNDGVWQRLEAKMVDLMQSQKPCGEIRIKTEADQSSTLADETPAGDHGSPENPPEGFVGPAVEPNVIIDDSLEDW